MNTKIQAAAEIRRIICDVTTSNRPNLGGHHGFSGSQLGNPEGLLRTASLFVGTVGAGKAPDAQIEELRALCMVEHATGLLADSDMDKINNLLDKIGES